ncbi:hypothetical protein BC832DRAFT_536381 [Gaertneriomyces semiglobifer]|nr:hypothetical protein BC832DRAFT_536381 [Gaertneriomyces semiglobifer]
MSSYPASSPAFNTVPPNTPVSTIGTPNSSIPATPTTPDGLAAAVDPTSPVGMSDPSSINAILATSPNGKRDPSPSKGFISHSHASPSPSFASVAAAAGKRPMSGTPTRGSSALARDSTSRSRNHTSASGSGVSGSEEGDSDSEDDERHLPVRARDLVDGHPAEESLSQYANVSSMVALVVVPFFQGLFYGLGEGAAKVLIGNYFGLEPIVALGGTRRDKVDGTRERRGGVSMARWFKREEQTPVTVAVAAAMPEPDLALLEWVDKSQEGERVDISEPRISVQLSEWKRRQLGLGLSSLEGYRTPLGVLHRPYC